MKKITFYLVAFLLTIFSWQGMAQTLNQNAGWPNTDWTVTGTYNSDPTSFEADPTVVANFAYDDDDAGSGDAPASIEAESPVIDLTAASTAGETWLSVSGDYVYNNVGTSETLEIQYWDADASAWTGWYAFALADTTGAPLDNFCGGDSEAYITSDLDISAFTATQLSGFKYRIAYDDGAGWQYGFCFQSPTIVSMIPPACPNVDNLVVANFTAPGNADIYWDVVTDATGYNWEIQPQGAAQGDATIVESGTVVTNVAAATTLVSGTDYTLYVQSDCGNGDLGNFKSYDFTFFLAPVNDDIANAIPITPSPEGTVCDSTSEFVAHYGGDGATDSGLDGTCLETSTGIDVFYTWTASTLGLLFSGGAGEPGIVIRDAATGDEITCASTWTTDVELSGWNIDDELIIQVYDYVDADVDVTFCLSLLPYFNPEITTEVTGDCTTSEYTVDVDVTNLGGATSVTVSDDQGNTQTASVAGVLNFGPYSANTAVDFTVVNDDSSSYSSTASALFYCPPANDNICDAIALTVDTPSTGDAYFNISATEEIGEPAGDCFNGGVNGSVWFTFVAPASGAVSVTTDILGGTLTDSEIAVYEAPTDCADASTMGAPVGCDQDGGETVNFNSIVVLDALTPGDTYYVQVDRWGTADAGTFGIEVQEALPDCPTLVFPADGAIDVTMRTDITWEAPTTGGIVSSYDVFYGIGAGTPADVFLLNTTDTFVNGLLIPDFDSTVLNWKIVTKNAVGDSVGCTEFSFTTVAAADDYDGDGVINSDEVSNEATDTDMTDPCDPAQEAGYADYDATNAIWAAADCDGDGETNGDEDAGGYDPYDADSNAASVEELETVGFEYYPNPVNSNLTVKANENILSIAIFNMLGQQVKQVTPSSLNAQIDMTNLANGTYFIKATVGERVGTFKIVKK